MSKQLGPLDISCDAPSYPVVQACSQLGFDRPEDVGWHRMGRFLNEEATRQGPFKFFALENLLAPGPREAHQCHCGERLPRLEGYTFVLISGKELSYLFGQCKRCRTMFWEKA